MAANGTASEVVVVEDWTSMVTTVPESTPDHAPRPRAVAKIFSAVPTSSCLSILLMSVITARIITTPPATRVMPPATSPSGEAAPSSRSTPGLVR